MTPQQLDDLRSIPAWQMFVVGRELKEVGKVRAAQLLELYDERVAIIAEGREATPDDFSAAWESTLHIKFSDFDRIGKRQDDDES